MDAILASPEFARSDRMCRFLRFVVERTLSGEEDSLKESVIGVRVFDREIGYDPKTDAIVRVEARRLRTKLAEYQAQTGADDPFWIVLPKGGYKPDFVWREPSRENASPPAAASPPARLRRVLVWSSILILCLTAAELTRRSMAPPIIAVRG